MCIFVNYLFGRDCWLLCCPGRYLVKLMSEILCACCCRRLPSTHTKNREEGKKESIDWPTWIIFPSFSVDGRGQSDCLLQRAQKKRKEKLFNRRANYERGLLERRIASRIIIDTLAEWSDTGDCAILWVVE